MTTKKMRFVKMSIACLALVGATVSISRYVDVMNSKCEALDVSRINLLAVEIYIASINKSNVSVIEADGMRKSYPRAQFADAEEYINLYPSCCYYYAKVMPTPAVSRTGISLSLWERFVQGKCGFVSMGAYSRYFKDNKVILKRGGSSRTWVVDNKYSFSELFEGR